MWSTAVFRSHMRGDCALCQQSSAALRGGHERHCSHSSWRDNDFDERCVSVYRPCKPYGAGTVSQLHQTALDLTEYRPQFFTSSEEISVRLIWPMRPAFSTPRF